LLVFEEEEVERKSFEKEDGLKFLVGNEADRMNAREG